LPKRCLKLSRLPPTSSPPGPLLERPHRVGKQLLPPLDDRFSARRGTYRVIYRIDDQAHVVTVVDIGHRRDVYRT
jgi:mRNA interferase RelE/StbE